MSAKGCSGGVGCWRRPSVTRPRFERHLPGAGDRLVLGGVRGASTPRGEDVALSSPDRFLRQARTGRRPRGRSYTTMPSTAWPARSCRRWTLTPRLTAPPSSCPSLWPSAQPSTVPRMPSQTERSTRPASLASSWVQPPEGARAPPGPTSDAHARGRSWLHYGAHPGRAGLR